MPLDRYVFAARDEPYTVVDFDLRERNRRFLAGIDPGYFEYLVSAHAGNLVGENQQRAAIALRTAYHHGIETLFTLLGAYIQAPLAVAAWIPKSSTGDLREIARRLQYGAALPTPTGPAQMLFVDLSKSVHDGAWGDDPSRDTTIQKFGQLWSRFASDLLDTLQQDEYNSIKHGFRVRAGGFAVQMGDEVRYGEAAPPEAMKTVGASLFGTSFSVLEGRDDQRAKRSTFEFRLRRVALNWTIERVTLALPLLAMSINNVVSKLRLMSGEPPENLKVQRPSEATAFFAPWRVTTGVTSSNMDLTVPWDEVDEPTRESLRSELGIEPHPPAG